MRVVLFLAGQHEDVYDLAIQMLTMHEKGEIKGQALRKKEAEAGKADCKPYILRPFLSLYPALH